MQIELRGVMQAPLDPITVEAYKNLKAEFAALPALTTEPRGW